MPEQEFGTFVVGAKSPFSFKSGIYLIRNKQSDRVYIGSAVYLYGRMRNHERRLELGLHKNSHLQSAWNRDGQSSFTFSVLLYCAKEDLIFFEQRALDVFIKERGRRSLYNIDLVAGSRLGWVPSLETRARRAISRRGKLHSEETKAGYRKARKGTRPPDLCFIRSREFHKGRPKSEEQKAKTSQSLMGHPVSAETVAKIKATKLAKKMLTSQDGQKRLFL